MECTFPAHNSVSHMIYEDIRCEHANIPELLFKIMTRFSVD